METVSNTIIAHPNSVEKLSALTAFMEALKIPFEVADNSSPYRKEFVEMILQGEHDKKKGRGRKVTVEEIDRLWK